jgi:hypothetical protein
MSETTMELEWTRKPAYEMHPAGTWKAQFVEWAPDRHQEFGLQVRLAFETQVEDAEGKPRRMTVWTKPSLHAKGRIFGLLMAFGIDPTKDIADEDLQNFSLDPYVGKKLRLQITHVAKKDAKGNAIAGEFTDKITGFLPFKEANVKLSSRFDDAEEAPAAPATEPAKPKAPKPPAAPAAPEPDWDEE